MQYKGWGLVRNYGLTKHADRTHAKFRQVSLTIWRLTATLVVVPHR